MFATAFILTHFALLMYFNAYSVFVCLCWTTRTYGVWSATRLPRALGVWAGTNLSERALANTAKKVEMEQVDFAVKVDCLGLSADLP
jgi:hypothetical protein